MLTKQDLTNLRGLIGVVVNERLEEHFETKFADKLDNIENKVDKTLKIASDTRQEQVLTQAKVDKHEEQIIELQSFVGLAAV